MGFPYAEATWDVVTGAMYLGAGGASSFWYTLISAAVCVYALWSGNRKEQARYKDYE